MAQKKEEKLNLSSFRNDKAPEKTSEWFYKWWVIVLAILFFGPLGLVLLWFRPKTENSIKIIVSIIVLMFSFWATYSSVDFYQEMLETYRASVGFESED